VLTGLLESWNALYANHAALRTGVEFLHIGGLVAGGGCAITADLATIAAARARSATLAVQLRLLKRTHVIVILGLSALVLSGLLMLAADVDTFLYSRIFWLKMGLMGALLINGVALVRGERGAGHAETQAWTRLHFIATTSLVLWFLTTLAGAALSNLG
jgi:predicted MFS family arabinose efflux permease